jgi:hypothetical protein
MAAGEAPPAAFCNSCIVVLVGTALVLLAAANSFPYFKDSGELSASLSTSGIAHPTGFPLQHVGASLARLLPVSSVSWRLTLLSVAGALVVMGAGLAVNLGRAAVPAGSPTLWQTFAGAAAWAGFLLCDTVRLHTLNVEVYLFSAGVSALVMLAGWRCVTAAGGGVEGARWWRVIWLLAGLSFGAHVTAVGVAGIVCLVVSVGLLWESSGQGRGQREREKEKGEGQGQGESGARGSFHVVGLLAQGLAFMAAGALVVLYLPLRASTGPVRNWGDPSDMAGFLAHVSGQSIRTAFSGTMLGGSVPAVFERWELYFESMAGQSLLLLPLALGGLVVAWRLSKAGALLWTGCLLFDALFSTMVNPMGQLEKQTGTISLLVLTALAGHAVVFLAGWGRGATVAAGGRSKAPGEPGRKGGRFEATGMGTLIARAAAGVASVALLLGPVVGREAGAGVTSSAAHDIGLLGLRQARPEALWATGSDDLSAIGLFFQEVEHRRPDVAHVIKQMACDLPAGSLLARGEERLELPRRLGGLVRAHCGTLDMAAVDSLWGAAAAVLVAEGWPVVWELGDAALDRHFEAVLDPGFPAFVAEPRQGPKAVPASPSDAFVPVLPEGEQDEFARAYLAQIERLSGAFLLRWKDRFEPGQGFEQGCRLIASAVQRVPTDCPSWNNLGVCRSQARDIEGALLSAARSVELCPDYFTGRINLLRYALLLDKADLAVRQVAELRERYDAERWQAALERLRGQLGALPDPAPARLLDSIR